MAVFDDDILIVEEHAYHPDEERTDERPVRSEDLLLSRLEEARAAAERDEISDPEGLRALLAEAKGEAESRGDLRLCEALGDFYRDAEPEALGITRSKLTDHAVYWYHKAAADKSCPRRGECGLQIARLSFFPKYENVRFKQAREWFCWAGDRLGSGEAFLYAGRIAEYEGNYDEASRLRAKSDLLSGSRRAEVDDACMHIRRGLDVPGGVRRLISLTEGGVVEAAVELAALLRYYDFPDELLDELPELEDVAKVLETDDSPDALAELAAIEHYCLEPEEDSVMSSSEMYIENLEEQNFFKMLETAWYEGDSALAAYYLGKIYRLQLDNALESEEDFPADELKELAVNALSYYELAADEGLPFAINACTVLRARVFGFDSGTVSHLKLMELFGEKEAAEEIRGMKELYEESSEFFANL